MNSRKSASVKFPTRCHVFDHSYSYYTGWIDLPQTSSSRIPNNDMSQHQGVYNIVTSIAMHSSTMHIMCIIWKAWCCFAGDDCLP
jgi:hypothetical protein